MMTTQKEIFSTYKKTEHLPFKISIVKTAEQLAKAVSIRQTAYARHLPEFASTLHRPEPSDTLPGTVIFLAESHVDGAPLGTMRMQSNANGPLDLEHSVELPSPYQGRRLLESSRLGVTAGSVGSVVKHALLKAGYLFSLYNDIDYMVVTARAPVDRHYTRLLFDDVFADKGYRPIEHVYNIPHRILSFDIAAGRERFFATNHPLKEFYMETYHPDIQVSSARETILSNQPNSVAAVEPEEMFA